MRAIQTLKTIQQLKVMQYNHQESAAIREQYSYFRGSTPLSGPEARWQSQVFKPFQKTIEVRPSLA